MLTTICSTNICKIRRSAPSRTFSPFKKSKLASSAKWVEENAESPSKNRTWSRNPQNFRIFQSWILKICVGEKTRQAHFQEECAVWSWRWNRVLPMETFWSRGRLSQSAGNLFRILWYLSIDCQLMPSNLAAIAIVKRAMAVRRLQSLSLWGLHLF